MIGIPLGLLYSNAGEWLIHKYSLHGQGKNRKSFWSFHWYEHHNAARKNRHYDPAYANTRWRWDARSKEAVGLLGLAAMHAPLFPVAPFFVSTIWLSTLNYYRVHKRAHIDPEWAIRKLPWHVDHHLGPDQNVNWCVSWPWFDWVMGTRKKYIGTEKWFADERKRAEKTANAAA
jgi:hypothetical protein